LPDVKERAILQQTGRTGGFIEFLKLPFQIFIATTKVPRHGELDDPYRKPAPGMWNFMVENCNGGIKPKLEECFYVGGAAGRPKAPGRREDHADYDIKFAENIGIQFHSDDAYFDKKDKLPGPRMLPRKPKRYPRQIIIDDEDEPEAETSSQTDKKPQENQMVQ